MVLPRDSEQLPSHSRGRLRLAEVDDLLGIVREAGVGVGDGGQSRLTW